MLNKLLVKKKNLSPPKRSAPSTVPPRHHPTPVSPPPSLEKFPRACRAGGRNSSPHKTPYPQVPRASSDSQPASQAAFADRASPDFPPAQTLGIWPWGGSAPRLHGAGCDLGLGSHPGRPHGNFYPALFRLSYNPAKPIRANAQLKAAAPSCQCLAWPGHWRLSAKETRSLCFQGGGSKSGEGTPA